MLTGIIILIWFIDLESAAINKIVILKTFSKYENGERFSSNSFLFSLLFFSFWGCVFYAGVFVVALGLSFVVQDLRCAD